MIYDFWLVTLSLVPLGAVTSQTVLDAMIILLLFGLIYKLIGNFRAEAPKFKILGIEWAFLGYFMVVLLGYYFNASKEAEIGWNLKKFLWIPHLYLFIYSFLNIRISHTRIIKFCSFFFLLPNLYALGSYIVGYDLITKIENKRILGLVTSATYHAHANAIVFVFYFACLYFGFNKLSTRMKFFSGLAFILFAASIFLTFTRGIWGSILMSTLLMYSLISFRSSIKLFMMALILGAVCYLSWPQFQERIQHSMSADKNHQRANLFMVNYKIWRDYPLLGIGYGENQRRNREYWDMLMLPDGYIISHAHNQYLNVMATTGVFGLFFFLFIFSFFLKKTWYLLKQTQKKFNPFRYTILFACLWAQVEFILACLTDVSFEYAKIRSLIVFVWALVIAIEMKPSLIDEDPKAAVRD